MYIHIQADVRFVYTKSGRYVKETQTRVIRKMSLYKVTRQVYCANQDNFLECWDLKICKHIEEISCDRDTTKKFTAKVPMYCK